MCGRARVSVATFTVEKRLALVTTWRSLKRVLDSARLWVDAHANRVPIYDKFKGDVFRGRLVIGDDFAAEERHRQHATDHRAIMRVCGADRDACALYFVRTV